MNKLEKLLLKKVSSIAFAIISFILTVIPEDIFKKIKIVDTSMDAINVIIMRIILCIIIFVLVKFIYIKWENNRKMVTIEDENCSIQIEYGNLFDVNDGKVVINFDECYTIKVGTSPIDIKKNSVCGQYLEKYPIESMQTLITNTGIKPEKEKSQYKGKEKYKPGTIIPHGKYLLMAFTKLDSRGLAHLTYDEYTACLDNLWQQIDIYHGTDDVYIPILGSKIVRFDKELTQQQLLDIMIASYRLSQNKLRLPYKLHIICREREGFSLNDVFGIG